MDTAVIVGNVWLNTVQPIAINFGPWTRSGMPASGNRADREIEYPTEKKCPQCGDTKPASEFTKNRTNLDGLQNNCKLCARWEQVRHRYGLSRDGWEAMWEAQGGRCVICQESMKRDGAARDSLRAVTDHCHGGGQVRALLHSECNRILGFFQDDPAIFRRAARYLELGAEGLVDVARLLDISERLK